MFYKTRIAVDIDGVLANSGLVLLDYINTEYGLSVKPEDIKDYWYQSLAPLIDPKKVNDAWKHIHKEGLLTDCPLMPNALLFNMLPGDVSLITHRDVVGSKATLDWLYKNHFYKHSNVLFAKGPKSQFGSWDYFLEDCVENVWDLSPHVKNKIILFNHPYNINDEIPENTIRVNGWEDVIEFFKVEIIKGSISNPR